MGCKQILSVFSVFLIIQSISYTQAWSNNNNYQKDSVTQYDFDLVRSVAAGAEVAISECAKQFKNEKWNCPRSAFYHDYSGQVTFLSHPGSSAEENIQNSNNNRKRSSSDSSNNNSNRRGGSSNSNFDASHGYLRFVRTPDKSELDANKNNKIPPPIIDRERAFVHAIVAAGITHTVTRNCTNGDFGKCGCNIGRIAKRDEDDDGFEWMGCSENIDFGNQVAQRFLDAALEKDHKSAYLLANLHNNEAGRVAVRKMMRKHCKCHGVSGSCAVRTCWNALSDFDRVGDFLKKMYRQALRVDYDPKKVRLGISQRKDNKKKNRKIKNKSKKNEKTELEIAAEGERLMNDLDMLYRIGSGNSKRRSEGERLKHRMDKLFQNRNSNLNKNKHDDDDDYKTSRFVTEQRRKLKRSRRMRRSDEQDDPEQPEQEPKVTDATVTETTEVDEKDNDNTGIKKTNNNKNAKRKSNNRKNKNKRNKNKNKKNRKHLRRLRTKNGRRNSTWWRNAGRRGSNRRGYRNNNNNSNKRNNNNKSKSRERRRGKDINDDDNVDTVNVQLEEEEFGDKFSRGMRYRRSDGIKKRRLVFLEESPDYCMAGEEEEGASSSTSTSILGRTCTVEASDPDSQASLDNCIRLCTQCGFKAEKKVQQVLSSCNCRFQWCCEVTCETCQKERTEITCVKP